MIDRWIQRAQYRITIIQLGLLNWRCRRMRAAVDREFDRMAQEGKKRAGSCVNS